MKRLNKLFNFLIAFIVLGYGAFFLYGEMKPKPKTGQFDLSSNDVEQVVNKYLKQTTEKMQLDRYQTETAIYKALKNPAAPSKSKLKTPEVNPADIPASQQIGKAIDEASPSEVINSELFNDKLSDQADEQARQQYAKDFIENARRGGFHVILSPDLSKIISVTPIRKPSGQDDSTEVFPSN